MSVVLSDDNFSYFSFQLYLAVNVFMCLSLFLFLQLYQSSVYLPVSLFVRLSGRSLDVSVSLCLSLCLSSKPPSVGLFRSALFVPMWPCAYCWRKDRSGKSLTEKQQILNRWTEYCSDLYNHKANGDPSVLNCLQTGTEDDHPILRKEVEAAVQLLKKGKSAGIDNIPAELVQAGGEDVITAVTTICNNIWQTVKWPAPWIQSLVIIPPNLQQCQNYRTISLISHTSKAILKIILNKLKLQSEKIIADEQAGFRADLQPTNPL